MNNDAPIQPQDETVIDPVELRGLEQRIQELEQALAVAQQDHKRALADYLNLQRVSREERLRFVQTATADLITLLLEPLDHLQRAAQHLQDKSLEMVRKQFMSVLEREGVVEIVALGQIFNPHQMEAVEAVPGKKDVVVQVHQAGYLLNGVLLRPAKVDVGNGENNPKQTKESK